MKRMATALLFFATGLTAVAEDTLYLKRIGISAGPERFELLDYRPLVLDSDTIELRSSDIEGCEKVDEIKRAGRTLYLSKNAWSHRYEVHSIAPGVSYMQSIGAGGGPRAPVRHETRPAWPFPSPKRTSVQQTPRSITKSGTSAFPAVKKRPFGWPAYNNPLERPAYR